MRGSAVLAVVFAAGLGAGYWWGAAEGGGNRRATPARDGAAAAAPDTASPATTNDGLARALADLPAVRLEAGDGTITGRVRTKDGKPVPGVLVRATAALDRPWPQVRPGEPPPEPTLEEHVRLSIENYRWAHGTRRETRTGPDGSYAIAGIAPRLAHWVRAYRTGYRIRKKRGQSDSGLTDGDTLDFVAERIAAMPLDVRLPDGVQAEKATVDLTLHGRRSRERWSRKRPTLFVAPGRYEVVASIEVGRGATHKSVPAVIDVPVDSPTPQTTLRLLPRPGILGSVVLPGGIESRSVGIRALRMRASDDQPLDRIARSGARAGRTRAPARFFLPDVTPGTYLVAACLDSIVLASRVVEVTNSTTPCELRVERWPAEFLEVSVFGPDGEPVNDATFTTAYRSPRRISSGGGSAIGLGNGRHLVVQHDTAGDAGGTHYVIVRSRRFGEREIAYRREEAVRVTVRFGEPARLTLTLDGYADSGAAGNVSVLLRAAGDDVHRLRRGSPSGGNGVTELGPVEAGDYTLVVLVGPRSRGIVASETPVRLRPGKNELKVAVPPVYVVVVEGVEAGGSVTLEPEQPRGGMPYVRGETPADGTVRFVQVPAGRYRVESRNGSVTVDVAGDRRVVLPGGRPGSGGGR